MAWFDHVQLPCGKYRGRSLNNLPISYLAWWMATTSLRKRYPDTSFAIMVLLAKRIEDGTAINQLLGAGFDMS
jgi:uncharacterized protein (DUF3820 family)